MPPFPALFRFAFVAALGLTTIAAGGCADDGLDVDTDRGSGGHGSFDEVEIYEATTSSLLATWSRTDGWLSADGAALDSLPPSVATEAGELAPLQAGGAPASLYINMRGEQTELELEPVDGTGSATTSAPACGEFSVRYFPLNDATSVIAWPNVAPPDSPGSPAQYAERSDGELVPIFYCDRLDIYPEQAGVAQLELLLWHVNHADQASDALAVDVQ